MIGMVVRHIKQKQAVYSLEVCSWSDLTALGLGSKHGFWQVRTTGIDLEMPLNTEHLQGPLSQGF